VTPSGPVEWAAGLRRALATGGSSVRTSNIPGARARQLEDSTGVVLRATGELVVRRGGSGSSASGHVRLVKPQLLANQRLGLRARGAFDAGATLSQVPASAATVASHARPCEVAASSVADPLVAASRANVATLAQTPHAIVFLQTESSTPRSDGGTVVPRTSPEEHSGGPIVRLAPLSEPPLLSLPPPPPLTSSLEYFLAIVLSSQGLGSTSAVFRSVRATAWEAGLGVLRCRSAVDVFRFLMA